MKDSDNWETPGWLMNMFRGWYDPCPLGGYKTNRDDLEGEWELMYQYPGIYINPPYSDVTPWIDKAIRTHQRYMAIGVRVPIVMLLKHDSSTKWFAKLQEAGARFLMIQGRLNFKSPNAIKHSCSPFPSVLAVLS